ncbi:hypothetical protein ACFWJT_06130 [Streptomyces sp. NPDC127069]|uniref:hypothetical protein n=1 Tax=Streptomyces sp. NPDC127069 TaxID=3347128 RepID=UPI003648ED7E
MKIRTETLHDTGRVREVITAAFGSPEDADLVDALRADACWIPELAGPDEAKMVPSLDGGPIPSGDMTFSKPMADAVNAYQPQ